MTTLPAAYVPTFQQVINALSDDIRDACAPAIRYDGAETCARRWFAQSANPMYSEEERRDYAAWAVGTCAAIASVIADHIKANPI